MTFFAYPLRHTHYMFQLKGRDRIHVLPTDDNAEFCAPPANCLFLIRTSRLRGARTASTSDRICKRALAKAKSLSDKKRSCRSVRVRPSTFSPGQKFIAQLRKRSHICFTARTHHYVGRFFEVAHPRHDFSTHDFAQASLQPISLDRVSAVFRDDHAYPRKRKRGS